jgi:hypothetical protein
MAPDVTFVSWINLNNSVLSRSGVLVSGPICHIRHIGPDCHIVAPYVTLGPRCHLFSPNWGKRQKTLVFLCVAAPNVTFTWIVTFLEPLISVDTLSYLSYTPYYIATINRCDIRGHPIYPGSEHFPSIQGGISFTSFVLPPSEKASLPSAHSLCSEKTSLVRHHLFLSLENLPSALSMLLLFQDRAIMKEKV